MSRLDQYAVVRVAAKALCRASRPEASCPCMVKGGECLSLDRFTLEAWRVVGDIEEAGYAITKTSVPSPVLHALDDAQRLRRMDLRNALGGNAGGMAPSLPALCPPAPARSGGPDVESTQAGGD